MLHTLKLTRALHPNVALSQNPDSYRHPRSFHPTLQVSSRVLLLTHRPCPPSFASAIALPALSGGFAPLTAVMEVGGASKLKVDSRALGTLQPGRGPKLETLSSKLQGGSC